MSIDELDLIELIKNAIVRKYFDIDFYRSMNQDLAELSDSELVEHYLYRGWRENRWPSAEFNQDEYMKEHPDVLKNDINPLLHFFFMSFFK